jgi:hypothetical protein
MSPTAEPKTCCEVLPGGKICGQWAMYKIGTKGFCEQHKPKPRVVLATHSRGPYVYSRHEAR